MYVVLSYRGKWIKNYWVAQSDATQGDKRAGVPEAQTVTKLLLQTRGLQKDTIQVQTIEAVRIRGCQIWLEI